MRILLVNQFFWPDNAATSQLLTDVARRLAAEGHEVHAVCSNAGYASHQESGTAVDVAHADTTAVHIRRTPAMPFQRGFAGRVISYASFLASAAWEGFRGPRPDVVLTLTTPPLISSIGFLLQRLRGSRHFVWEMDVYPDIAVDLGVLRRGSLTERTIGLLADAGRNSADGVIALGECMRERLVRRGVRPEKLHVAENWADGTQIRPLPLSDRGPLKVLYSGNLGLAHDTGTIAMAMGALRDDKRFQFSFVGGGARRAALETWATTEGIENISFGGYRSREDLGNSLCAGDIGLVTQRPDCVGSVVPSKVYGLMAAGRPILFIGPRESTVARIVERFGCGWHIDIGDGDGLADLLRRLADCRQLVQAAGTCARQAFDENYHLPLGTRRIAEILGAVPPSEPRAVPVTPAAAHS